ncbi:hypothetical protein BKA70DRAFT_1283559 [Coprinopsis sp. MPI-PUGE-AT-0042]|nr:hypothetical protein BKA70DRAFT_1283559 [Coprinopsis sp. MPI-PUGE-AT-0042]
MSDTRAAKRARVEEDSTLFMPNDTSRVGSENAEADDESETEIEESTRRSDVWLSDGNIILKVDGTQFRVHKSILSMHSTVFADMLENPQLRRTGGRLPIVKLGGDQSYQWEWLLGLLYDGRRKYATTQRFEYTLIESMITLGDKYDISHVLREALGQFESAFPSRFHLVASPDFPETGFDLDDYSTICDVVGLVKRFRIETSLPAIYYHILIQDDFPAILHTGTLRWGPKEKTYFDKDTQAVLISGRDRVYEAMAQHQFYWLWADHEVIPCKGCPRQRSCRNALDTLLGELWRPVPEIILALQPYGATKIDKGLCNVCASVVKAEYMKGQKAFWEDLPTYFGLPSWGQLSPGPV